MKRTYSFYRYEFFIALSAEGRVEFKVDSSIVLGLGVVLIGMHQVGDQV
jgi:hypothetical protein